eukprot:Mycagemm_TRINITY_DN7718_c0_g2::TRINITY_DN7718_c0_g2_i1::g.3576::m.3576 type:complete len:138 gc:universal TRINITY_DN7718_c0_g2_i1:499-86(-)
MILWRCTCVLWMFHARNYRTCQVQLRRWTLNTRSTMKITKKRRTRVRKRRRVRKMKKTRVIRKQTRGRGCTVNVGKPTKHRQEESFPRQIRLASYLTTKPQNGARDLPSIYSRNLALNDFWGVTFLHRHRRRKVCWP